MINLAPTDAQKEAGNYKKGHVWIQGLDITIENPKGSVRSEVAALKDYCAAFSDGKRHARIGSVEAMSMPAFKEWLRAGNTKKPVRAIVDRALRLVRA